MTSAQVPTSDEIRGLTFYTSNPDGTVIEIVDNPILTDSIIQAMVFILALRCSGIHPIRRTTP